METRREFLKKSATIVSGVSVVGIGAISLSSCNDSNNPLFKIKFCHLFYF